MTNDKWLILENEQEFVTLNAMLDRELGYPTPDMKTLTYAEAEPHSDPKDPRVAIAIQERAEPFLTDNQLSRLLTETQMRALGWFTIKNKPGA